MKNRINILLLEDNPNDAELVYKQVLKSGIKFQWLHSSELDAFIKALSDFKPDLILSDYNLVGFTGLDALKVARKKCPLVPFIIVTGTLNDETAVETIKKGAWDYVVKDRLAHLNTAIKNVLQLKEEKEKSALDREKLKISEERYMLSVEGSKDGIWDRDLKTNYVYYSLRWKSMLGYNDNDIDNSYETWETLLHPDDKKNTLYLLNKHLKNKISYYEAEFRLKCKDGSYKWILARGKAKFDENGKPYRIAGSHTDISERKRVEEELILAKNKAEEGDRLKTAFLHNVSHEIRTPLNAIVGFSGFLIDPCLVHEKREHYAKIIIQSSDQLLSIIDDIMRIASIEARQEEIQENEINLNLICNLIEEQFFSKTPDKNITLSFNTNLPDNEVIIISDTTKLTQILTNLIGNALKFTPQGYVKFGYTVKDKQLEFYVEDSGIGIPLDMQDIIFSRFRQVESTITREYGGSGLGLSISKAYAELLGGRMWLKSELGKGSVFYFTIPYRKANPKKIPVIPSVKKLSIEFTKPKTLLIAEDEDSNFELLEELLDDENISLIRAINGLEAVKICKSNQHIDLVLMDIKMPNMDGIEATIKIKEFDPDLPIIAQTAYSTDTDKDKALACGCSGFISKPINREFFISIITEQLQKPKKKSAHIGNAFLLP